MPTLDDDLEADLQSIYLHPIEVPDVAPVLRRGRHRQWRLRGALGAAVAAIAAAVAIAGPLNDPPDTIKTADEPPPVTTPTSTQPTATGRTLADVTVLVLNASGRSGVAGRLTCELQDLGLRTAVPQNADTGPVDSSSAFGLPGYEIAAQELATQLGIPLAAAPTQLIAQVEASHAQVGLIAAADQADARSSGGSSTSTSVPAVDAPCSP